jgi:nicotinamide-nucleotide amidase
MIQRKFINLAKQLGRALEKKNLMLVTAESCTGGQVAEIITSVSGSASWFERGFITYSNIAKQEMLGVRAATIKKYGAVSIETVKEMAEGAILHSHAQISLAVTGIAGPTGGTKQKPVGTICFAWAGKNIKTKTSKQRFHGDRTSIRSQAAEFALEQLLAFICS